MQQTSAQYQHFSIKEREDIQRGLWEQRSIRSIARALGRSPSSVSREIRRNRRHQKGRYSPRRAHERALEKRRSRGRTERLKNDRIRTYVISHLKRGWSPERIAGSIRVDRGERISHEAIYQFVYAQVHRVGKDVKPSSEDLRPFLRRQRKWRLPRRSRR